MKEPMEVSRVTSGGPPSELAHIFGREKGGFFYRLISVEGKLEREEKAKEKKRRAIFISKGGYI